MEQHKKMLKLGTLLFIWTALFTVQLSATQVRNDMRFICKYEGQRHFSVPQDAIATRPIERNSRGFVVYAKTPKNTNRALYFKCQFNRYGEYRSIRKTNDRRYDGGNHVTRLPRTAKRICRGEASARWRMRPHDIRITKTKRLGRNDFMVQLAGRHYRGKCEVSRSGHLYHFRTKNGGNRIGNAVPSVAKRACRQQAGYRWGVRPQNIRITQGRRVGRDDYIVSLALRYNHAECEVSGRGRIYLFSGY